MSRNKRQTKPIGVSRSTGNKLIARENALLETLQDAETRQLESFIKTRSQELDEDIKSIRQKLKMSDNSVENDSLKARVAAVDLNVTGKGLGRVEFNTETFTQNVTKMKDTLPKFQLDPSRHNIQPKTVKDHLVILLAKIKLSKYRRGTTGCYLKYF